MLYFDVTLSSGRTEFGNKVVCVQNRRVTTLKNNFVFVLIHFTIEQNNKP